MRPCEAVRGLLKSSSGALGNSWGAIGEPLGCLGCFWGSSWEPLGLPGGLPGGGAAQEKKETKQNKEIIKKGRKCKPETIPKETPTGHTLVVFDVGALGVSWVPPEMLVGASWDHLGNFRVLELGIES